MSCPGRQEILDAINGVADPAAVEAHVETCPACREAYDGMMAATEIFTRTPYSAPPGGCLDEARLIAYARRQILPEREREIEEHLSRCPKCIDEVAALAEALEAEPDEVSEDLRRRVLRLVPHTESGIQRALAGRSRRLHSSRFRREKAPFLVWAVAAAAVVLVAIILLALPGQPPQAPIVKEVPRKEAPKVEEPPRPEAPKPPPPKPERALVEERKPDPPKPVPAPKPEEPKVVRAPDPPKPETPRPVPPPPVPKKEEAPVVKKTEVEAVKSPKYKGITLAAVNGPVSRRGAGGVEEARKGMEVRRGDELFTTHRQPASFKAPGYTVTLDRNTGLLLEEQEEGETRAVLLNGTALFTVDKRERPFVVGTPHAEAVVVGTSFQVVMDERHTVLHVLEGAIRFRNEKGEVLVNANQRSTARIGEKPAAPARHPGEAEAAWARRPDLTGSTAKDPWIEHAPGGNRKFGGLVVAAPYFEGETDAGRLARMLSESMDVGLLLGHHYRDREKAVWMNVDRGTEVPMAGPTSSVRALAVPTDRVRKETAEYLAQLRLAAGLAEGRPVPMVICLRNHSEVVAGKEFEVCEVAVTGWNRRVVEQLKAFYGQLLEKYKPAYRVEMRFEGVDDRYTYRGQPRDFKFTEGDAEGDGYLSPRHSQYGLTFFFNASFGTPPEDFAVYAKILGEMAEFLWSRRR